MAGARRLGDVCANLLRGRVIEAQALRPGMDFIGQHGDHADPAPLPHRQCRSLSIVGTQPSSTYLVDQANGGSDGRVRGRLPSSVVQP